MIRAFVPCVVSASLALLACGAEPEESGFVVRFTPAWVGELGSTFRMELAREDEPARVIESWVSGANDASRGRSPSVSPGRYLLRVAAVSRDCWIYARGERAIELPAAGAIEIELAEARPIEPLDAERCIPRDVLRAPFARGSIWNTPIGRDAQYVDAEITRATEPGPYQEDVVVLDRPEAPSTEFFRTNYASGCPGATSTSLFQAPLPEDYVYSTMGPAPVVAILLPGSGLVREASAFARCAPSATPTADFAPAPFRLDADGLGGAHGGSQLSALGGTLRVGELRPGARVEHALKVGLHAKALLAPCTELAGCEGEEGCCYVWPARAAHGYANESTPGGRGYGRSATGVRPSQLRMGALLAIPPDVDVEAIELETEPARALAWTLQNYGAYVASDTGYDVYSLHVETGPDGDFEDEFEATWSGVAFDGPGSAWRRDLDVLFPLLAVVIDNGPTSIGGGGPRRVPRPPPPAE